MSLGSCISWSRWDRQSPTTGSAEVQTFYTCCGSSWRRWS